MTELLHARWTPPRLEALLEQSRAQTAALQQIAAQQRASEDARIVAQHAQTDRAVQVNGARIAIDGAVPSAHPAGASETPRRRVREKRTAGSAN